MSSRSKKITLILGAGASHAMGYPVGADLRKKILSLIDLDRRTFVNNAGLEFDSDMFEDFIYDFRRSQMLSIDAFLARRPEFSEIGKKSIAALLLEIEDENSLIYNEREDHWYRYFFNKFSSENWENLDFSNVSIVTFNYDRSLEKFMHEAIKNSYGKNSSDAAKKLKTMNIVHVYGSLGSPIPGEDGYLKYGGEVTKDRVIAAADGLRVIPEGRDSDDTLCSAREIIIESDKIAFMGFGFDETNVKRLQADKTCIRKVIREDVGYIYRDIVATCKGFTSAEARKAFHLIGQEFDIADANKNKPRGFYFAGCLELLRETLVLD